MPTPSTLASDGDTQPDPKESWRRAVDACSDLLDAVRELKRTFGELKDTLDRIEERNKQ